MREFDIESVGKKMPYDTPTEEFFESITTQTVSRALREEARRTTLRRVVIGVMSLTAAAIVALVITTPIPTSKPSYETELAQLDKNLDKYFESLS